MFKPETLRKYSENIRTKMSEYERMNADDLHVAFSYGNKKIGRVLNVSLAPIVTCHNCKECKNLCYDIKACLQYTNVTNARARNTVLATLYRDKYFNEIDGKLSRRKKNLYFRWHVGGDIPDYNYFERMVDIARKFPNVKFWTYTKNYGVVNLFCMAYGKESIPTNLSIMFSEWRGMELINPFNFPIFTVEFDGEDIHERINESLYKCTGNCEICTANNLGCVGGMSSYVHAH